MKFMAMPRRALVVDGESRTCKLLEEVLLSAGIETVTMVASTEAPARLREGKFDVVLVDLSLPSSDGLALTRAIRSTGFNRTTPIVVIGDAHKRDMLTHGFAAGASFLIYKPIDRLRLARLLRVTQGAIDQERRRFQRVPVRTKVRLKAAGAETDGETIDLSMNGTLVSASRVFPTGSIVEVALFLGASPKPVTGRGSVVRVVGLDRMGIQLDGLSLNENQRLQEYLLPHVDALLQSNVQAG
jgi:CheY-like chemotaxis protein